MDCEKKDAIGMIRAIDLQIFGKVDIQQTLHCEAAPIIMHHQADWRGKNMTEE